jgi:hypothetical protein
MINLTWPASFFRLKANLLKKILWDDDLLNWRQRSGTKNSSPIEEEKMNKNGLFVLAITLALVTMAALVVGTRPGAPAVASSNAAAVDRQFPGKEKDDIAAPMNALDRQFPGKEKDDIVAPKNVLDRQFPGKEKDDIVAPKNVLDRQFPGKEKDDLFVNEFP